MKALLRPSRGSMSGGPTAIGRQLNFDCIQDFYCDRRLPRESTFTTSRLQPYLSLVEQEDPSDRFDYPLEEKNRRFNCDYQSIAIMAAINLMVPSIK